MAKIRIFASFSLILILTLLFVNCTEDSSPTTPSIDYIAPYVEWINPASSAELSGTVEVSFSVYDENGIDSVKLYVNGSIFLGSADIPPIAVEGKPVGEKIPPCPPFKKGGNNTPKNVCPTGIGKIPPYPPFKKGGNDFPSAVHLFSKGETPNIVPSFSKGEIANIVPPFSKGGIKGGFSPCSASSDTTITITWNTLDYDDGVCILEARAWDTSGNLGTSPSLMVNVKNETDPSEDHFPPMIVWVAPEASSEVSGDVTLRFNAMDNIGIDSLKLYINGVCPEGYTLQGQQEAEYSIVWTTEDFKDGVYSLEARAWDTSGNMGTSPSLMVNVNNETDPPEDRLAPYVHWIAPEGGSTLKDTVSLQVGLFDENGIDSVKLYINGALFLGSADASPSAIAEPVPAKAGRGKKGGVTLSVFKSTSAMNSCSIRKPPLYSPLLCRGDEHTNTDEVVSHFCKDENACTTSPFSKVGIKGGFNLANSSDTTITIAWNTLDYEDGVYILEARAWDISGNLGISPALMVNVKNNEEPPPEDRTPPVVSWISPEPGTEVSGDVELCFQVMDDVGLDSVQVYLNGQKWQNFKYIENYFNENATWITSDYQDDNYIVEVRAWDTSGNVGSSEVIWFTVRNNVPRVIWVPDDYRKIQNAINASEDGDTVRVRAGTYYEGLRLMGKEMWLESEEGPEVTIIDATGWAHGIVNINQGAQVTIRGFCIAPCEYTGISGQVGSLSIYNCIIKGDWSINGIWCSESEAYIYNCVVDSVNYGIWLHYCHGYAYNSIMINCNIGYREQVGYNNWIDYGWNLFWRNENDYQGAEQHPSDVFADPLFEDNTYKLQKNSPAIDSGKPDILDRDGSRSDIGVHGGPYSY